MINNRKNDMAVEREIAVFLDEKLYGNKELFKEYARTDEFDEQIAGSDIIITTADDKIVRSVVDEKVASRFANTKLDTFALELSFISKSGKKRCGWLLDNTKKTEYYLFGWILEADIPYLKERKRFDTDKIRKDNIKTLEWVLVKRSDIIKFLESKGWTLEKLSKQDEIIRERGEIRTKEFIDEVSFRYSDAYIEKPINVLLKKDTYIKISTLHGIINAK